MLQELESLLPEAMEIEEVEVVTTSAVVEAAKPLR